MSAGRGYSQHACLWCRPMQRRAHENLARQELLLGVRQPRGACEHLEEEPKVVEPVAEGRGAGGGQAPPMFCLVCNITSCLATSISKSIIFFPLKTCSFATPKNILEGKKEGQLQEFPIIHS